MQLQITHVNLFVSSTHISGVGLWAAGRRKMNYPKKIMRASELEKYLGFPRGAIARMYHLPGQKFAFKARPECSNSPVLIDTTEFEKWKLKNQKMSAVG